jgi:hypothetical protein
MPSFDFRCEICDYDTTRIIPFLERGIQICPFCRFSLRQIFSPTKQKPIVYGATSLHPHQFTGPKQRQRLLNERGLIELGDAPLDEVKKEGSRWAKDAEREAQKRVDTAVDEVMSDLGDDLYEHH